MDSIDGYRHGGDSRHDLIRFGLDERPLLDFSVNLNPLGPPEVVREKWNDLLSSVEDYPGVEGEGIVEYYRNRFGLSPDNILAGNGSTEMIYLVPRALGFKNVAVITPSYHDYERASLLAGSEVVRLPLSLENDFASPAISDLAGTIKQVDALWLGRPNNPTGTLVSKDYIINIARQFPDKWFIVDEAFIQFVDNWEELSLLREAPHPNLLVIHSLTKFYSLAGLRLGGIAGHEEAIRRIRSLKEPWTVNGVANRVAPLLLDCKDYETRSLSLAATERKRAYDKLNGLDGFRAFPPSANFILCQWGRSPDLDDLLLHLLSRGACVRDCRNFPGLREGFFRIGIKNAGDNDTLISLLESSPYG